MLWAMEPSTLHELCSRADARAAPRRRGGGATVDGETAVIEIRGVLEKDLSFWSALLGGTSTREVGAAVLGAASDPAIRQIVLLIDSPGGQVAGTAELARIIAEARGRKQVTAVIEDVGASAAYWLAAQAHSVFAGPTAVVGGIGTYGVVLDSSGAFAAAGLKIHIVRAGEHKGAGVHGTEITPEQLAEFQRVVDQTNERFVAGVAAGRRLTAEQARRLADGRVYVGAAAKAVGLIDGVATPREVLADLRQTNEARAATARPPAARIPGYVAINRRAAELKRSGMTPAFAHAQARSEAAQAPRRKLSIRRL